MLPQRVVMTLVAMLRLATPARTLPRPQPTTRFVTSDAEGPFVRRDVEGPKVMPVVHLDGDASRGLFFDCGCV